MEYVLADGDASTDVINVTLSLNASSLSLSDGGHYGHWGHTTSSPTWLARLVQINSWKPKAQICLLKDHGTEEVSGFAVVVCDCLDDILRRFHWPLTSSVSVLPINSFADTRVEEVGVGRVGLLHPLHRVRRLRSRITGIHHRLHHHTPITSFLIHRLNSDLRVWSIALHMSIPSLITSLAIVQKPTRSVSLTSK